MSSSFFRSTAAVAVIGVGALLTSPAAAQTCYPPTADCVTTTTAGSGALSISLSATTVTRGQTVSATIGGFKAGTSGIVTIASVEQQIGSFTMPAGGGSATTTITIPTNISLGAHTVFARGTTPAGAAGSASQTVLVVAGTSTSGTGGSTLARTGVYLIPASIIGLGLVGGGIALKRKGRRTKVKTAA